MTSRFQTAKWAEAMLLFVAGIAFAAAPLLARPLPPPNIVVRWSSVAINAIAVDSAIGGPGLQLGPTRASRAMAIVHIAISDAVNGITGEFKSYTGLSSASATISVDAAVAQAAHDTLLGLYPNQRRLLISSWPKIWPVSKNPRQLTEVHSARRWPVLFWPNAPTTDLPLTAQASQSFTLTVNYPDSGVPTRSIPMLLR